MKHIPVILLTLLCPIIAYSQAINVAEYGAQANSFEDATEQIKQAIQACKDKSAKTLIFPKGRYDIYPNNAEKRELYVSNTSSEVECPDKTKFIGLLFENMNDLIIEGNGSTFVFHGKMTPWSFINSTNMILNNIIIDFERPTMSELTFLEIHPDHIIAQIHPDSKYTLIDGKIHWYGEDWNLGSRRHAVSSDSIQGINRYSDFKPLQEAKATQLNSYNKLRFDGQFKTQYREGEILSIRNPIRDQVGAFVYLSKNIKLNNVTMHYMHGLGITSQFSENLDYRNVKIFPSRGRTIAAFADGMQFSGCKGYINIDNCHFKGLHDDPINVHGTYLQIVEKISPHELIVEFKHHQTYGFKAFWEGDSISYVSQEAIQSKGISVVKKATMIGERQMKIVLENTIPKAVKLGDCLENLTWTPSLTVTNSRFERINTRGILVTTPRKVLIENNVFYRTGMHAILIAGDVNSWFESGATTDITIKNNHFIECAYNLANDNYQIAIAPENHKIIKNHWVHQNIKITDNIFEVYSPQILKAKSVNKLTFKNNSIKYSHPKTELSEIFKKYDIPTFKIDNCTNVKLISDETEFDKNSYVIECLNMKKSDIKTNLRISSK